MSGSMDWNCGLANDAIVLVLEMVFVEATGRYMSTCFDERGLLLYLQSVLELNEVCHDVRTLTSGNICCCSSKLGHLQVFPVWSFLIDKPYQSGPVHGLQGYQVPRYPSTSVGR